MIDVIPQNILLTSDTFSEIDNKQIPNSMRDKNLVSLKLIFDIR